MNMKGMAGERLSNFKIFLGIEKAHYSAVQILSSFWRNFLSILMKKNMKPEHKFF